MLKGYTPFIVIIKYWLYSLCCTIYPCSLFILYRVVCGSLDLTPILPLPPAPAPQGTPGLIFFLWGPFLKALLNLLQYCLCFMFFLASRYVGSWGFPGGSDGKKSACQCRRRGFDPWVQKGVGGLPSTVSPGKSKSFLSKSLRI